MNGSQAVLKEVRYYRPLLEFIRDPKTEKIICQYDSDTDTIVFKQSRYHISLNMTSGELVVVDERRSIDAKLSLTAYRSRRT